MTEPYQLTVWPNYALPGQMPLFNQRVVVCLVSDKVPQHLERCESLEGRHFAPPIHTAAANGTYRQT